MITLWTDRGSYQCFRNETARFKGANVAIDSITNGALIWFRGAYHKVVATNTNEAVQ